MAAAPSLQDLSKRYEDLDIGLKPRHSEAAEEPSEGGMGNAHKAGVAGGLELCREPSRAAATTLGTTPTPGPLPGESEVVVLVTVSPQRRGHQRPHPRTNSGITALDQHALAKARDIVFDALPPGVPQVDSTGTVRFKFEWNGAAVR